MRQGQHLMWLTADNSDARCHWYYRRGLRIRFYMTVHLKNRSFYSCTVKGYNTSLQLWRDWRGARANFPPGKLNPKTGLVFSGLLFFAFFGVFFNCFRWFRVFVYRNPHSDTLSFLNFFLSVGEWPLTVSSGPLSATFPTIANPLVTPVVYNSIMLNNFLLHSTKYAYNQRGFSKRCLRNCQLTKGKC